jgi:Domain of unknown function (DUF4214)
MKEVNETIKHASHHSMISRKWLLVIPFSIIAAMIVVTSLPSGKSIGAGATGAPRLVPPANPASGNSSRRGSRSPHRKDFFGGLTATAHGQRALDVGNTDSEPLKESDLIEREQYWADRLGYPTGEFDPAWVREAADRDHLIPRSIPSGRWAELRRDSPLALNPNGFTALGPSPERMTGCTGCFDYTTTQGRVNAIAIDPTTTTNGSIVAYIAAVGGGVWKTTNCCSGPTTWTSITDDPVVSTASVDTIVIDPNNHNTIYVGTGDLNYGSFSMGSQGILKSTDSGANWTMLGANVFGAPYPEPPGQFPQYQAVGKVRVDPNNSNKVVAGTKTGLYLSYDGGVNWTGPCLTNAFTTQRQDITGLELTNIGGTTRILAAVGTRGFATTVQYDLGNNGANGLYGGTIPASGCPSDFSLLSRNNNGFVFGTMVTGSPYSTGANMNAGTGAPYVSSISGNQLGRMDIAVAPSNPNYVYAQVGSIAANNNSGCGNTSGCQLGVWSSIDGGGTWSFMTGSAGGSLTPCSGTPGGGDYPQNWYDQGLTVDPNNPDRVFVDTFDTWLASRIGLTFYNLTCGYNGASAANHVVHVDHHALAFVPGSSSILLEGSDGGIFGSNNADTAVAGVLRNTWFNMYTGLNTIEFYSGDISGNFATSASPQAVGGAQDNGPSSVTFSGSPTGPVQWQMGLGGDGFYARIDPVGTGSSLRFWEGNNSGGVSRCVSNCTASGASWTSSRGSWTGDTQSFILPYDIFHGGIPGGDDCAAAGVPGGCGHLIAGTTRVWETISGGNSSVPTSAWYVTNNPTTQNMTKQTLGNRSFINQVKYSPKFQSVAIVGTNDANVWIGFNLGTGAASQANWVNVTGGNTVLPNRPVLGIALSPGVAAANVPVGYAAVGGFDQNTPTTPGHVFRVSCTANCGSSTWENKSGNLPNIPVDSIIVNPNLPQQVFAGTDFGLYFTNDITAASPVWSRFNSGLPNVMIWDMQIDRGATALSLWTRGRGAFAAPLPMGPTAANASISGRITTPGGSALGGAVIHLNGTMSRMTVSDSAGNYHFDDLATDSFYIVTPSLANYTFTPSNRSFSLTGNRTDEMFTANPDASPSANAIDTAEYFVRQQYLDFLGREPDQGGLEYWSSQFTPCGSDATCISNKRIDVSAAFFASLEFQQTGSYIYGLYAGTLGREPGYGEFMPDRAQVVGGSGLEPAKAAFAQNFVQRAEFTNRYPQSMSREEFVDAVIQTMQVRSGMFMTSYRDRFLNDYDTGGRALVVRHAAEAGDFVAAEYNRAFVLMEYFGYLRRDIDPGGYAFWLDVLNRGAGSRGMVCSFLTSHEYQNRFSTVVTHSNAECGQ